jgi:uncharacterized protein YutE (UPF0331/DUF86 family)
MSGDAEPTDSFLNFIYAFGAARKLLERAHELGFLIECIVLYVSLIDGLLRMAIVLDKQLAGDETGDIDSYIQQAQGGPKFSERDIYKEAHRRGLIDDPLKLEIEELYDARNAIIHRFFLNGVTYASLGPLLDRYEEVYNRCYKLVDDLEERQLAEGKGMTRHGPADDRHDFASAVLRKIGLDEPS